MKRLVNPWIMLGVVLLWRVALLVFTAQPIPANDSFVYDGGILNWLHGGHYVNPSILVAYPISGGEVFSLYPPLYQLALLAWTPMFGTSALSVMAMHLMMFAISAALTVAIIQKFFPENKFSCLAVLLLFGFTFNDRPEGLAHIFGLVSLALVTLQLSDERPSLSMAVAVALALLLTLYTSLIVGAFYFGTTFLVCAAAWPWKPWKLLFAPHIATVVAFGIITFCIIKTEPLWWQGFLENAHKQSVVDGFRIPPLGDLLKLVRTLPVFFVGLAFFPMLFKHRKRITDGDHTWLFLMAGIFVMGWILIFADMVLLAPNYIFYAYFTQIILAAGMLTLAEHIFEDTGVQVVRIIFEVCIVLVSVRALGMTTWGAVCASKNGYDKTQVILHRELQPYVHNNTPVVISSAYLYAAQDMGVQRPIHSDYYYYKPDSDPDADVKGMAKLKPTKLVLTQFDYYRSFQPMFRRLKLAPGFLAIEIHDQATVPTPDAIPRMRRVVQHISWAPVIVDLKWK